MRKSTAKYVQKYVVILIFGGEKNAKCIGLVGLIYICIDRRRAK